MPFIVVDDSRPSSPELSCSSTVAHSRSSTSMAVTSVVTSTCDLGHKTVSPRRTSALAAKADGVRKQVPMMTFDVLTSFHQIVRSPALFYQISHFTGHFSVSSSVQRYNVCRSKWVGAIIVQLAKIAAENVDSVLTEAWLSALNARLKSSTYVRCSLAVSETITRMK